MITSTELLKLGKLKEKPEKEENGTTKEKLNTTKKKDNYLDPYLMKLKSNSLMIDTTSGLEAKEMEI